MANRAPGGTTRRRRGRAGTMAAPPAPVLPLAGALRVVRDDLIALDVKYALVGGLAVSARAEPRLTRDVDLAVAVETDALAEQLLRALLARGYRMTATIEQVGTGRLATARLTPREHSRLVVDLLFATCGIEHEIVDRAEDLEILPGLIVPVARSSDLIAMKVLARDDRQRPQDLDDIRALIAVMSPAEGRRVPAALKLIAKRGYGRGRDLLALWRDAAGLP